MGVFKPFKIIFELKTPPVLSRYTFLDGIVAFCMVKEHKGDLSILEKLPLKKHDSGVYHASMWFAEDTNIKNIRNASAFIKQSVLDDLDFIPKDTGIGKTKKKINSLTHQVVSHFTGSGAYKTYMININFNSLKSVYFYGNGDGEEILRLIKKHLFCLGKFGKLGYGLIGDVKIEYLNEDKSLFINNKPVRPLPKDAFNNLNCPLGMVAVRPPYWKNFEKAYLPTMRIREDFLRG